MAEFEQTLNAILGNQEAMGQIMALARSLSGEESQPEPQQEPQMTEAPCAAGGEGIPDLSALMGSLDPNMLQMGMRMVQQLQGKDDRNTALLMALRPFVREERRDKLDRALQIARMTRMIRTAFGVMGGKGGGEGV